MRLRRAERGDAEAVRALIGELGYGGHDPETFAGGFARVLEDPASIVWLAEDDGRALGVMALSHRPQIRLCASLMTVDEIVVAEDARGKGVGQVLLERAKEEARKAGATRLELHTQRARPSYARGFYAKAGFVEVDSAVMRWEGAVGLRFE